MTHFAQEILQSDKYEYHRYCDACNRTFLDRAAIKVTVRNAHARRAHSAVVVRLARDARSERVRLRQRFHRTPLSSLFRKRGDAFPVLPFKEPDVDVVAAIADDSHPLFETSKPSSLTMFQYVVRVEELLGGVRRRIGVRHVARGVANWPTIPGDPVGKCRAFFARATSSGPIRSGRAVFVRICARGVIAARARDG